jgi:voltage-gated potassium channel
MHITKERVFTIIQIGQEKDIASRVFDFGIIAVILINSFLAIFETFEAAVPYESVIWYGELATVLIFTAEYMLRAWTSDLLYPGKTRGRALLRYIFSFNGIVDLLSFLPFYLPFFFPSGIIMFRMFRVVRILRLFRINPYYDALNVIAEVLRRKRSQLLSSIFIILVLMIASSLVMYGLEHTAQPDVFNNAFSGFWWAVSTLLTVGYGDIYPITVAGRIFGIISTFLGVGMVAIPTGILSAGFVEHVTELQKPKSPSYCPHCGGKL